MKFLNKTFLKGGLLASMAVSLLVGVAFVGTVSAACVQYDANGTSTSKTPVFNQFCGVPNGVGNESDFVRVRQNATGNPTTGDNAAYVDTLNSTCAVGAKYDVRTYVHNGADPAYNTAGGASAIAHNVVVAQTAKLNQADKNFTFTSKVTASNAASVTDTAKLNCGKDVVLKLVPTSVHVYSKTLGWNGAPDSAVNGTLKVGSRVLGSGDQLGCWDDRIIVVYEVVVEEAPKPQPQLLVCDALSKLTQTSNRTVRIDEVKYTISGGATFTNYSINWGDGTISNGVNLPQSHTYAKSGTYKIVASVNGTKNGVATTVTSDNCAKTIDSKKVTVCEPTTGKTIEVEEDQAGNYKPVGDKACTPTTPPTTLVNTGAGDILGLFAAVTVGGALAHRFVLARRNG